MPLKDLSGKSVYDLDREDFENLFCHQCKKEESCIKDVYIMRVCQCQIDGGIWYKNNQK